MKTYKHLYSQIYAFENLYQAFRCARLGGKRKQESVAAFELDLEANLWQLQAELRDRTYRPGAYHNFYIRERKRRLISAAPFRDRVVHHALCRVVQPIFERRMIADSYACRVGKGTHKALDRAQIFARRFRYVLQCDIRQFFPSIDHEVLRGLMCRCIADEQVLRLVDLILRSGQHILRNEYRMQWFPGDDLLAACRPRGLPIGNLTSQNWANLYLDALDHFVKERLRCKGYLRYCDDFLLFDDDKSRLWAWRDETIQFLYSLRLRLHEDRAQVFPAGSGISWLGFRVFPYHRRLRPDNVAAFVKRLRLLQTAYGEGTIDFDRLTRSIQGWVAHAKHGDTYRLRTRILDNVVFRRF